MITRLSSWRAFPVIARNSSFQYRGGNVDLKRVSRELGVRYVVEGSVRRAGERIRVNAQLIDAPSGEHVWAETYDRKVADVFTLQDEISAIIAASLVGDLTRAEGERARQRGTNNLEAWSLYQLGLQHFDQYTLAGFAEARGMFQRAAEVDPRFATPQGQLAVAGLSELMLGRSGPHEEFVASLMSSARRAVELDPRDPCGAPRAGGGLPRRGRYQERTRIEPKGCGPQPEHADGLDLAGLGTTPRRGPGDYDHRDGAGEKVEPAGRHGLDPRQLRRGLLGTRPL